MLTTRWLFAVGDYLVADGEGGEIHVAHDDGQIAIDAQVPGGQRIRLLCDIDDATTHGCHVCTMAHYLRRPTW